MTNMKTDKNLETTDIKLIQLPVIEYHKLQELGTAVNNRIESLDVTALVATEDTVKDIKALRTELGKEFSAFEERRKFVKSLIMKPYDDFNASYDTHIATAYKKADMVLKSKIDAVEISILKAKIDGLETYFKEVNPYDFVTFEDIGLKINKSTTDNVYRKQIDTFSQRIESDICTISTMINSELILAKYHLSKDFNKSIAEANLEAEQIKKIASKKTIPETKELLQPVMEDATPQVVETKPVDEKVYKTGFTVYGTKEQFAKLKKFMEMEGIRYE